ncbi:TetR/AcrR family transcriptional regulator [Chitinophaga ginsengisoli]|uniref:TetR family transcriptional regulator n=1 Tax=Chitinophaga ginsengisoli TaxID=363837 RepID=A0A2P8GAF9_9BACT|nr:TetR/AcrR family transcriptional regulator [Chitinophaga ginsengisoli]PSL30951.1 TetR family transcriptional regulator [Chitinophaga ginsengisoli]
MARARNFDEDEVLDKAIDIFRRQGFKTTTPEELVTHLGLSRSSLYNTYGDKRSLFIRSLQRYQEQTSKALNDLADSGTDAMTAIRNIFEFTVDNCLQDDMPKGCFLVNSIVEFGSEDTETVAVVKESMETNRNTLLRLVKKGQKEGSISNIAKPAALADYLVNCLSGISVSSKAGADKNACEAIVKNSLAILQPQKSPIPA